MSAATSGRSTRRCAAVAVLLALLLPGCAGLPHLARPPDALDDPALQAAAEALLCRVAARCDDLRLHLVDRADEQAEMFPDGRLHLHLGLLLATRGEADLAFVLAHEAAHRELRHRPGRTPAQRARLEIEADRRAVVRLAALGLPARPARALLARLLAADQADAAAPASEALAQTRARLVALDRLLAELDDPPTDAAADARWAALLARYRKPGKCTSCAFPE